MNTITCADCDHTDTRGRMHIRTRAFVQVAFCARCWAWRVRLAELTRVVTQGIAA